MRAIVHAQYQQEFGVASQAANNTRKLPISGDHYDVRGVAYSAPPTHRRATQEVLNDKS